jgi:hypothetical protein
MRTAEGSGQHGIISCANSRQNAEAEGGGAVKGNGEMEVGLTIPTPEMGRHELSTAVESHHPSPKSFRQHPYR